MIGYGKKGFYRFVWVSWLEILSGNGLLFKVYDGDNKLSCDLEVEVGICLMGYFRRIGE